MSDVTVCDELIAALEAQRDAGVETVWLSPENLAWLDEAAAATKGANPASTAAMKQAAAARSAAGASVPQAAAPTRPVMRQPEAVKPAAPVAGPPSQPAQETPKAVPVAPAPLPDLQVSLPELATVVAGCRRCGLCDGRRQTVFGVGNPEADLMFVGEGPGADEDRVGEPFVGPAGQLLTKILSAGMGLRREDVYIANVVKCRPPQNRNAQDDEAAACLPYLRRQIELVAPRVIVVLGAVPLRYLVGKRGITRLRGTWLEFDGIPVMPTFHPSYLLRVPAAKREVWQDVQLVMAKLGLERPQA